MKTLLILLTSAALGAAACGSSATVSTAPTPAKCQVSLSAPQSALDPGGGSATVVVATQAECAWTAASDVGWITGFTPAAGQGAGEVRFQVAANPTPSMRQGRITLNGVTAQVSQAGVSCRVDISSQAQSIEAPGGSGAVEVAAPGSCAWTASSSAPWLTISSGASGSGNGTVSFRVAANTGVARLGALAISDKTFVVTQSAPSAPQCNYAIQTASVNVGAGAGTSVVNIQADDSCSWTAASNVAWLAVAGVGIGSGNGSVTISVSPNTGVARSGTVTIAGRTFTVTQAGSCAASLNPPSATLGASGGAGPSIAVSIAPGCAWTASTTDSWLSITQGAGGTGNGAVAFSAAANTGSVRTGSLTIAGQTLAVTQSGSCATSITPSSQSLPATSGGGSAIAVSAPGGCAWTATTSTPWITITGGASGSGNGSVTFTVAANSGSGRTGTLIVGAQTHTVTQAGSCAASLNPPSATLVAAGGAGPSIAVSIATGCAWTAATTDSWLSITQGASGTGNGTVAFSASANTGNVRTGSLTIAGQTFAVTQPGSCATSINPSSQSLPATAGGGSAVAVSAAACAWTATTSAPWITITGGASGTGNGSVTFTVPANTGSGRTGTISIGTNTHTVTQAGSCTSTIAPPSQSVAAGGGAAASIAVTAGAGCTWSATPSQNWITITAGASGSGNGTVALSVAANTGPARTATVAIAGQTHTVSQANGCTYTLTPTSHSLDKDAQTPPTIAVTTAAGCTWTAVSNDSFITVENGDSGTGSGTVKYKVTKNSTSGTRTGTLTIAGRTFTVIQTNNEPE